MKKKSMYTIVVFIFGLISIMFSQQRVTFFMMDNTTIIEEIELNIVKNTVELYNKRNSNKLDYTIEKVTYFHQMFDKIEEYSKTNEKNSVIAISSISVTDERSKRYDFSPIYLPSKNVIFTLKSNLNVAWNKEGSRIAYQPKTLQEKHVTFIKEKYKVNPIPFKSFDERLEAVVTNKVEYSIADNVEIWGNPNIMMIHVFEHQYTDGIAMMYPKNSTLKPKLDPILNYYLKSKKFYSLIRNKFGNEVSEYFRKNL